MLRSAEWSRKAHEVNDRVLDLLVADRVSELYAFTLFVNPEQPASVLRYLPLPGDRWVHRVYPPIPLSPAVAAGLRENDHDLHASCSDDHIRTVLVKIGSLEAEVKHNQKVEDRLNVCLRARSMPQLVDERECKTRPCQLWQTRMIMTI